MKLFHLSDLHLGKRLNEFSLLEDQAYILTEILALVESERPDGVIIAGDIYDKSVPSAEAVQMFDKFLCALAARKTAVFAVSGNHDSAERIAFGGQLMAESGVYVSPVYGGTVAPITLHDAFGAVNVYLLPFVKPASVRRYFPEKEIASASDAVRAAVEQMRIDTTQRNLLVAHQFVTGAARSESEEISVGGADNVDAAVFDGFDYVALGHIHGPQSIGRESLRYCGTPLKYSFSESGHVKSVTVAELGEKGDVHVRTLPLRPLRDLREIRGSYMEVTAKQFYDGTPTEDYLRVTLTDEEDVPNALGKLRVIYPNLMELKYDNRRTRTAAQIDAAQGVETRAPGELFAEFYEKQNNRPMSAEQAEFAAKLIESIWEGEA
ncbi:MAG: exonuclease SbcCD subunit D [Ruminococcaceae bacterium]|nr:exonuclease SbcCD subunit D [Oscillospiraceae bacterium]